MTNDYEVALARLDECGPAGLIFEVGHIEIRHALRIAAKLQEEPSDEMVIRIQEETILGASTVGKVYKLMVAQLLKEVENEKTITAN